MEELAAEIRAAIPSITEPQMTRLMQDLADKGVRSMNDTFKVKPVDMVNALGTEKAKKLAAYFTAKCVSCPADTFEIRTDLLDEALEDCECLNETLDERHTKRQEVLQETLRTVEQKGQKVAEIHTAALEDMTRALTDVTRAHEEMLRNWREEERRRAERHAERLRGTIEEGSWALAIPPIHQDGVWIWSLIRDLVLFNMPTWAYQLCLRYWYGSQE